MDLLVVRQLHKTYVGGQGGVPALRGVEFSAPRGDFVAVRGPSGCGKSTLLHIVGAMDRPSQGQVWLNGRLLNELPLAELTRLRRRHIGFIFQAFHLLPTLTVRENVMLPLRLDGTGERTARARADHLLEQVDLVGRATHFPAQLSGGEMQRAAVARAVVAEPELLLADEPTGNLDSDNGRRVMELLADLNRQTQVTILLATHSAEAASLRPPNLYLRDGLVERTESHGSLADPV